MDKYYDVAFYVLLTAISFVFIDHLGEHINPVFSLFIMAMIATIWFNLINAKNITKVYIGCIHNRKLYVYMTLSVAINWLSSIFAPHLADPFLYLSIYFIVLALCGFGVKFFKNKTIPSLLSIVLLVSCIVFIYTYYDILDNKNLEIGLFLGIIGGISAYLYALSSNKLAQKLNITSTQILAVRFIPLCIVLFLYLILSHLFLYGVNQIIILFVMAIISLILPVYFNQQAIRKLGVVASSIGISFTPACVFIIYTLFQANFKMVNFIICIFISCSLGLPNLISLIRKNNND